MIKASIIGATGYTGQELVKMLSGHPHIEIVGLGSKSYAGENFSKIYPHFRGIDLICENPENDEIIDKADIIFLALPHGLSVPYVKKALEKGKKVVDLGADFRIKDRDIYQSWYKTQGPEEDLLEKAVYGLCEINKEKIAGAQIVANPGCYPTTILLALIPLLQKGAIKKQNIIIDSKSGVSGAGRSLSLNTHLCETNEDLKAYGLPLHRHIPEMEQELSLNAEEEINITFTPHLIPMTRGMLSTIYLELEEGFTGEKVHSLLKEFYKDKHFVRIIGEGESPHTKWVSGSNYCDIGIFSDPRNNRITILSAIDNLIKGASGQAIQNMNIMFGLDEKAGLPLWGMYP
ncbi:N-acetyl-gamma-glutamyl-phosphate reductase [Desulfonispora thiosulfatigenes DSM 11270]|uniref:N-acetyl-gamma-glutamyl-phosphate reductase n=1 Tax=Desulfonispora thiosulfatigenes DSM 11270 TaxID=656914 RepID=A0A1W1VBK7_DESTI|nr:N-acetyl-gamma-glutamyl-phosphate reductase [Desulfonispora thiosulfatigenes]SMB90742.1 N-acetyl-gamma-glutamyl-phosphate reductase [Desulfonispora thiosulfatigenes DSM 11270]